MTPAVLQNLKRKDKNSKQLAKYLKLLYDEPSKLLLTFTLSNSRHHQFRA